MKFIKIFEEFTEDIEIKQSEYDNAVKSLINGQHKLISKENISTLNKSLTVSLGNRYKIEDKNYDIINPGSEHSVPMLSVTPINSGRLEYYKNISIILCNDLYYVKAIVRNGDSKFYKFNKLGDIIKLIS
jgi:hypothetical protein